MEARRTRARVLHLGTLSFNTDNGENPWRKHTNYENNIKTNKEDTLQGMRAMTTRRGHREDNNGKENAKTKRL